MPMVYSTISAAHLATARPGNSRTLFASGTKAYELLPDDLKEQAGMWRERIIIAVITVITVMINLIIIMMIMIMITITIIFT